MEDIQERIKRLKKEKSINFYLSLLTVLLFTFILISAYPNASHFSERLFLHYIGINLVICLFFIFLCTKNAPISGYKDRPEQYLQALVHQTISANQMAVLFFFIPTLFATIGIYILKVSWNEQPRYWAYGIVIIFWIVSIFRWRKTRKLLNEEYRKLHDSFILWII